MSLPSVVTLPEPVRAKCSPTRTRTPHTANPSPTPNRLSTRRTLSFVNHSAFPNVWYDTNVPAGVSNAFESDNFDKVHRSLRMST